MACPTCLALKPGQFCYQHPVRPNFSQNFRRPDNWTSPREITAAIKGSIKMQPGKWYAVVLKTKKTETMLCRFTSGPLVCLRDSKGNEYNLHSLEIQSYKEAE